MRVYQQLVGILSRHISSMNAESVVARAIRDCGLVGERVQLEDLDIVMPRLEAGIRLFLDPTRQRKLKDDLNALVAGVLEATSIDIEIKKESDISDARMQARAMCGKLATRPVVMQKIATVVSELARNINNYTPGGRIVISVIERTRAGREIRYVQIDATDSGRGIPNLDLVMSGRYKSSTGMGKGLKGVKALSTHFDVQTSSSGTRVIAEVAI